MPRPVFSVQSVAEFDEDILPGTLMEHNDPPSMVVMVTGVPEGKSFSGVCLNDGHYASNDWAFDEFHIFRGQLTLSQGV